MDMNGAERGPVLEIELRGLSPRRPPTGREIFAARQKRERFSEGSLLETGVAE
jgi:hypothetical protein